jgi:hypothetical protein
MPAFDFLDVSAQDRRFFGAFGGRLMAIVAVTVLVWLLLVDQRDEARHKLPTFTPSAHAAEYQKTVAKLKETAQASNAFLVVVAVLIGAMVLVYEGTAWGLGWALARLADAPRPGGKPEGN